MLGGNGFVGREYAVWRKIFVLAWVISILLITFFASRAYANDAVVSCGIFSPDAGRINLYKTLNFEAFKASGTEEERAALEERLASVKPASFFTEEMKKINKQVTMLVIGMMYCLDGKAAYPYVEAIKDANPFVSAWYLVYEDTPGAREFLISRTGRTATPSIFIVRNGEVLNGAYVEAPSRVVALLEAAKNEKHCKTKFSIEKFVQKRANGSNNSRWCS